MFKEFSNKNEVSCINYQNDSKGCQHMDVSRTRAVKEKKNWYLPWVENFDIYS